MTAKGQRAVAKYIAPAVILTALVWAAPLLFSVWLSFTDATPGKMGSFVGGSNYLRLLSDRAFFHSVNVSIIFAAGSVVLNIGLGLIIAIALRTRQKVQTMAQGALLLPWILSELAVALIWNGFLDERSGLVNTAMVKMGAAPLPFFSNHVGAMIALWLASLWRGLAFSVMLQMAGISTLRTNLIFAARIDGAGWIQIFRSVIWPHQARIISVNAILVFLMAMVSFSLPFALTKGSPLFATDFVALHAYNTAFSGNLDLGYAAAQGMMVLVAYGLLALVLIKFRKKVR